MSVEIPSLSSFREISLALFEELIELLQQGRHLALIGPRQSGKEIILFELQLRSQSLVFADRPDVVILRPVDFRADSRSQFLERLASQFGGSSYDPLNCEGQTLAADVFEVLRQAVSERKKPLWLFVPNITELAWPFVRGILQGLQTAFADSEFRGKFAVVITGGQDFVPLTYDANSPYRHADKFFLQGFDREITRRFFLARIVGISLNQGFVEPPPEVTPQVDENAMDYLFEQTGGYSRFIEEIVVTAGRLRRPSGGHGVNNTWHQPRIKELIGRFLNEYISYDYYFRTAIRELGRHSEAWAKLESLVDHPAGNVFTRESHPHLLETSGIARRHGRLKLVFASPMWERSLKALLNQQYRADTYAKLGEWATAGSLYTGLKAADCDRPIDGDERDRLNAVIDLWEDHLVEVSVVGAFKVVDHFLWGARHLYGCEAGRLFDQTSHRVIHEFSVFSQPLTSFLVHDASSPILDDSIELLINSANTGIESAPKANPLLEQSNIELKLQLRRPNQREIDATTLQRMRKSIRRFWLAYTTAERMEHAELRQKHLDVVARVNLLPEQYPGRMGDVVAGTVDALLKLGGYYRIQICLINPKKNRIQAVASGCLDPAKDFKFPSDWSLKEQIPERDWDIQRWVATKGVAVAINDVCDPNQHSPRTRDVHTDIGMVGIAVVPMKIAQSDGAADEIVGTIHFERQDKLRPAEFELKSFQILAGQIAVTFANSRWRTMMEQALNALQNEFRIVAPDRTVVFQNLAADESDQLHPPHSHDDNCQRNVPATFSNPVIHDAAQTQKPAHRYVDMAAECHTASDDFAAPIHDWRSDLKAPLVSDGMIGYVYLSYDLSDFARIHKASQHWLGRTTIRDTANSILDYFRNEGFSWCRIYLYEAPPLDKFQSFEEYGIADPDVRERFRNKDFVIERGPNGKQAFFLLEILKDLAILQYDPNECSDTVPDGEFYCGVKTIRHSDNLRRFFGKTDENWIEAPLIVGDAKVGLIVLHLPKEFSPRFYQMLKWSVVSAAIALHNARDAEQKIQQATRHSVEIAKDEAWQSAAQLAIHQLANKIGPAESECHFVKAWLKAQPWQNLDGYAQVDAALTNAQQCMEFSSEILKDFRRYASEKPFDDIRETGIHEFLELVQNHLRRTCAQLTLNVLRELPRSLATSPPTIRYSQSAMLEVFEVLAFNSLAHAGKQNGEPVEASIKVADMSKASEDLDGEHEKNICFLYSDNGAGISERDRPRIFDAFYTTSQSGNGLGLSIAMRFMIRQGGSIMECGTAGSGAMFRVCLPKVGVTHQGVQS